MEALPEVLRVAVSEALTSGKKLSWSVWDNGEITSVKLLWKPDVSSPVQSEIPPRPAAASTLHLRPRHNVKKKRSPSSWRRGNQRLKSFLEKKNSQEKQEHCTVSLEKSEKESSTFCSTQIWKMSVASQLHSCSIAPYRALRNDLSDCYYTFLTLYKCNTNLIGQ